MWSLNFIYRKSVLVLKYMKFIYQAIKLEKRENMRKTELNLLK